MPSCLLLFTRYPVAGKTKTRLTPFLTPQEAAQLHRSMTETIAATIRRLQQQTTIDVEVWFTGCSLTQIKNWLGEGFTYADQGEGDLGERLKRGFKHSFDKGFDKVIGIGSDCPALTAADLKQALDSLNDHDCVLGPALDGGYYLIGLRNFYPALFTDISWSTPIVLQQTITAIKQLGLSWSELRPLGDIDRPEDLGLWLQCQLKTEDIPQISIVIPTLNEAKQIKDTLLSLKEYAVEIIIVDGGSTDQTIGIAESLGVVVIKTVPHRARQMNLGATTAKGDILLFLHADTKLPQEFPTYITATLAKPNTVAGAFMLEIDSDRWGLNLVAWGANQRSKILQRPYGDQGIFLTRRVFESVQGFKEIKIMEDFDLITKLQKLGKIKIADAKVKTSPRRWQRLGIVKTTLVNQLIILGYYLGIDPDRLAHWYRSIK